MQKLILTQEVSGLGAPGDLVEVKDGYARNYLVPQGLAIKATKGAEKQIATIRKAREVRDIRDVGSAQDIATQLGSLSVKLTARAGEGGRLFGSVTPADVVDAVSAAGGPKLDKRRLEIAQPIKTVGSHQVSVQLHPEVSATVTVEVVGG
ncbi:MAG: large subunit ribosomal protein [Frankiaceae bacterium]|jgi:large subunit ribosomal protein L9|nr:large subunit ribosomal protein [Frankiaceae bacterium]MDX6225602.1 large subunit ribosomal protein [Frankiales bacterium]MDX6273332.1 large subunit ribosomal protein [Frankiales bacterium]